MESIEEVLAREFPPEISISVKVPILDKLAEIKSKLHAAIPDCSVDLQEWMGMISLSVTPFRCATYNRTSKVVWS